MQFRTGAPEQLLEVRRNENPAEVPVAPRNRVRSGIEKHDVIEFLELSSRRIHLVSGSKCNQRSCDQDSRDVGHFPV